LRALSFSWKLIILYDVNYGIAATEESSLSLGTEATNETHVLHPVSQQSKGIGLGRRFGNRFRRRSQIEANEVSIQAKNAIDIPQPDADKKLAESGHLSCVLDPATKSNALVKSSESAHFSVSTNNHATVDFSGNNHQSHGAENSFDQEKAEVKKSVESTRDNNDHAGNAPTSKDADGEMRKDIASNSSNEGIRVTGDIFDNDLSIAEDDAMDGNEEGVEAHVEKKIVVEHESSAAFGLERGFSVESDSTDFDSEDQQLPSKIPSNDGDEDSIFNKVSINHGPTITSVEYDHEHILYR
jgi:hypothetical protein